jgi:hypothetical protein
MSWSAPTSWPFQYSVENSGLSLQNGWRTSTFVLLLPDDSIEFRRTVLSRKNFSSGLINSEEFNTVFDMISII